MIHFFHSGEQPELKLENDYPNKTGHNLKSNSTTSVLYGRTNCVGNSIFVKSNIKLFVKFINGNLSRKFLKHGTFSFQSRERA